MAAENSHLTGAVRPAKVHEQRTRWHRPGHFRRQQAQLRGTAAQEFRRSRGWDQQERPQMCEQSDRYPALQFLLGSPLSDVQSVPGYDRPLPGTTAV